LLKKKNKRKLRGNQISKKDFAILHKQLLSILLHSLAFYKIRSKEREEREREREKTFKKL